MKNFSSVDQDYKLWVLLDQAEHAVSKAREKELSHYSITTVQAAVLFIIQAIGNEATPAEISRWLFRKSHSVSGLLSRMEKEGLVRKVKDLDRKNMVRVTLTEKGQQIYRQSNKRRFIRKIMSCLSEEEHQQLTSCLERLRNKAFKELGVNPKPPFP